MNLISKISQGIDFSVRFTLEVLGASGAVWGASEAFCLRNEENKEYWRVGAIAIGIFALIRFVYHNTSFNRRVEEEPSVELRVSISS